MTPLCSDCRRPAVVLVLTDYGCRYCPACLRPPRLDKPIVRAVTLKVRGKAHKWAP